MESDRRALLNQILEYHFACIELNLYLDNNPDDEDALYHDFLEREKEFSTGLQDGFAIPHARTDNVKKVTVMFLRNKNGIDWQTLDDKPVKYIFALLVPKQSAGDVHLKMISSLATALLEDEFKDTIISSNDKAELTRYILKIKEEKN